MAINFRSRMKAIIEILRDYITRARAIAENISNRRQNYGLIYRVKNLVWVNIRNIIIN